MSTDVSISGMYPCSFNPPSQLGKCSSKVSVIMLLIRFSLEMSSPSYWLVDVRASSRLL